MRLRAYDTRRSAVLSGDLIIHVRATCMNVSTLARVGQGSQRNVAQVCVRLRAQPADEFVGAPEGIRTPDPQIRSLVLYPAELPAP